MDTAVKEDTLVTNSARKKRSFVIPVVAMIAIAGAFYAFYSLRPCAITVDGQPICYVNNRGTAQKAIDQVVEEYAPEDTTLKAFDTGERLKVVDIDIFKAARSELSDVKAAAASIKDAASAKKNGSDPLEIVVASTDTKVEPYKPEPNYKKDKTMLAGESEVKTKGKDGKQKVSTTYTTVNGELSGSAVTAREILDKGKKATIIKGTLGLPEGEDWKTYEGDPVFNDGEDLMVTAAQYIGKVRYKLGGYDLSKGVSCLGLVKAIYAKYGIRLPMSHSKMKKVGIGVPYSKARKGDIICYKSHVGLYLGNGKMIDATSHAGISIRSVSKKKLVTVRRIAK